MKRSLLICVIAVLAAGCATQRTSRRASVVEFLYPNKARPIDVPGPTTMALPLRVGVAFVPENGIHHGPHGPYNYALQTASDFTEKDKTTLMQNIGESFKRYPFVRSVEFIPTQYLRPGGGFDNLDQLRSMFGIDVMVLLSYDQTQFTDEGFWTLSYWTVVGAYVVEGERNETHTMIDAAVYHLPNRRLLFRAPGMSRVKASSTPVNLSEELRLDSRQGFELAAANIVTNLDAQLAVFKDRIKDEPQEFRVVAKPGYDLKAVGQLDWVTVLGIIAVAAGMFAAQQRRNQQ